MKKLFFVLFLIPLFSHTSKTDALILSGVSTDNVAHLSWQYNGVPVIEKYHVQRKVNQGNLKDWYETIITLDGSANSFDVPMNNGKNIFRVVASSVPTNNVVYGYWSNTLSLN